MFNIDISALERAVSIAEGVEPQVGYDILLAASKRYIRGQRAKPQQNICPSCGLINMGAHFCVGRSGSGTQKWVSDYYATSVGSCDDLRSRGIGGSVGAGMGAAINGSEAQSKG